MDDRGAVLLTLWSRRHRLRSRNRLLCVNGSVTELLCHLSSHAPSVMSDVLKWQKERQDAGRGRLGSAWTDHDLVFARDGFKLYRGEAGGPQDPEKVSARWRTLRNRLHLPDQFRIHD